MERNTGKSQRIGPLSLEEASERILERRGGAAAKVDGLEPGHFEEELLDNIGSKILIDILLRQELLQVWG